MDGGIGVANETVPSTAVYLAGAAFVGSGSPETTGTAQVYRSGNTILLHLEGLATPAGTAYAVFLENGSPSSPFYFSQLKAQRGNQNYFTGRAEPAGAFTRVVLRATTSTISTEMATASLPPY